MTPRYLLLPYFVISPIIPCLFSLQGNESEDIVEEAEESTSEDNMMPATKKAAKAAPKKKAGPKTTGDVEGDDFVANVSPQPIDDRSYNINMADGWIRVQYSEGLVDYIMIEFHVNGILPEGGWRIVFNEDENKVSFQRAIHKFLFSKEHLSSIMNPGEYSSTHSRVVAVDHSAQRMMTDRVEESGDFFWGRAQVVNLNVKCTGTPQISYKAYKSGLIVGRHKQYNCVCTCRVQVAAQRTETMQRVEKGVVQMFDLPSSQSSMDSPPDRCKPKGNKRSYVDDSPDGY